MAGSRFAASALIACRPFLLPSTFARPHLARGSWRAGGHVAVAGVPGCQENNVPDTHGKLLHGILKSFGMGVQSSYATSSAGSAGAAMSRPATPSGSGMWLKQHSDLGPQTGSVPRAADMHLGAGPPFETRLLGRLSPQDAARVANRAESVARLAAQVAVLQMQLDVELKALAEEAQGGQITDESWRGLAVAAAAAAVSTPAPASASFVHGRMQQHLDWNLDEHAPSSELEVHGNKARTSASWADWVTTSFGHDAAAVMAQFQPKAVMPGVAAMDEHIREMAAVREGPLYVMDFGELLRLWKVWRDAMPRVKPFYAVKCNPEPALLSVLAALGAGFDVASKAELEAVEGVLQGVGRVTAAGVSEFPFSGTGGGSSGREASWQVNGGYGGVGRVHILEELGERIIFANPCKLVSHIQAAAAKGVHLTTFDSVSELEKLQTANPHARAVLRLRIDDSGARCPLGTKYGADVAHAEGLLEVAKRLGVKLAGVAFHVGSGASDARPFAEGVAAARMVYDLAVANDMAGDWEIVDVGGGFTAPRLPARPGSKVGSAGGESVEGDAVAFADAAAKINEALDQHFPAGDFPRLRIIGEPGRFFAETPFTLAAQVFGTRACAVDQAVGQRSSPASGDCPAVPRPTLELATPQPLFSAEAAAVPPPTTAVHHEYWINDGIYGSMNCLLYDHATLEARPLLMTQQAHCDCEEQDARWEKCGENETMEQQEEGGPLFESTVFGPTCDGLDTVLTNVALPRMSRGDWLLFPSMGAYTKAAGSSFNGFSSADIGTSFVVSLPGELPV